MMTVDDVYAPPRDVTDVKDCYFYHTMDVPGHGTVQGEWDLRGRESVYLGGVDVRGKRVLEMGTASGALGFWMDRQGADVVGYDLSPEQDWDLVPFARATAGSESRASRKERIRQLNNGWWFAHRAFGARARVVHGDVYHVPAEIGPVDVATFGSILLHVRDPFLALWNGTRLARETAVVVDVSPRQPLSWRERLRSSPWPRGPFMRFQPDHAAEQLGETWWLLAPELIVRMLGVLGFEDARVHHHTQKFQGLGTTKVVNLYTVVAQRTQGQVEPPPNAD